MPLREIFVRYYLSWDRLVTVVVDVEVILYLSFCFEGLLDFSSMFIVMLASI